MASNSTLRQYRTIFYIVAAAVALWLLLKVWRIFPGHAGGKDSVVGAPSSSARVGMGEYRI